MFFEMIKRATVYMVTWTETPAAKEAIITTVHLIELELITRLATLPW